ncbi:MAG: FAD-dependent oxidoreductase [Cyclobacteriaceae bacterium]|nr:FAD-dependent oxidoreductase [Cyclobacteriaceae bacterium]
MKKRIIVIGGLSAGPSAAAKARRTDENAEIVLFEKTRFVSYATCGIPYALSGVINDREKLMIVEPDLLRNRFNIDVRLEEEVIEIVPENHEVITSKGSYRYDKLIFAAGASSFVPPIVGLDAAQNWSNVRSIEDYDKIIRDGVLEDKKNIVVLGAGLIGVEVAENLNKVGKNVSVIEMANSVLSVWDKKFGNMSQTVLEEKGVTVFTNATLKSVKIVNDKIVGGVLGDGQEVHIDYLLTGIGGRPNTGLLTSKGASALGNGALIVNERMETSLPDIYAAGDCASIKNIQTGEQDYFPMGTHSNKGGRTAGANAAGGSETFKGAYKTAIVKVFDYTLGRTGHNATSLTKLNVDYSSIFFVAPATPGFYPDQTDLYIEVWYSNTNKTILGAEIFGLNGVDKRIDVFSTAIYAKLTLEDLPNLDLAYAPPFSTAKDPVVVAGFIGNNSNETGISNISVQKLEKMIGDGTYIQLIDVRNEIELEKEGVIEGAINVPLEKLRNRLASLDASLPTVVYCARGLRGYVASTILNNNGFGELLNLGGGFKGWLAQGGKVDVYNQNESWEEVLVETES